MPRFWEFARGYAGLRGVDGYTARPANHDFLHLQSPPPRPGTTQSIPFPISFTTNMPPFLPPVNTVLVLERFGSDDWFGLPKGCGGKPTTKTFTISSSLSSEVLNYITIDELKQFVGEINEIYSAAHVPTCPLFLINIILPFSSLLISGSYHRRMNSRIKTAVYKWNKALEKRGIYFEHLRKRIGDKYKAYICFCRNPSAKALPVGYRSTIVLVNGQSNMHLDSELALRPISSNVSLKDIDSQVNTPPKQASRNPIRGSFSTQAVVPVNHADDLGEL